MKDLLLASLSNPGMECFILLVPTTTAHEDESYTISVIREGPAETIFIRSFLEIRFCEIALFPSVDTIK